MMGASKPDPAGTSLLNGDLDPAIDDHSNGPVRPQRVDAEQPRIPLPIKDRPRTVRKTREYSKGCAGGAETAAETSSIVESFAGLRITLRGLRVFRRDRLAPPIACRYL
jgi:hypothetical protein